MVSSLRHLLGKEVHFLKPELILHAVQVCAYLTSWRGPLIAPFASCKPSPADTDIKMRCEIYKKVIQTSSSNILYANLPLMYIWSKNEVILIYKMGSLKVILLEQWICLQAAIFAPKHNHYQNYVDMFLPKGSVPIKHYADNHILYVTSMGLSVLTSQNKWEGLHILSCPQLIEMSFNTSLVPFFYSH